MKRKMLVLVGIFLVIPMWMFAQNKYEHQANTKFGTSLKFSSYKGNNGYYTATVVQYYYDTDNKVQCISISINELNIFKFEKELLSIQDYYKKWSLTAKNNNVVDIEKEIPVQITSIDLSHCAIGHPNEKNIKVIFKVMSSRPICILRITVGLNLSTSNKHYTREWWFCDDEILAMLDQAGVSIWKQRELDNKKQNTLDLFK